MLSIERGSEHPNRRVLNNEVHARPPEKLHTPCSITYVVRLSAREPSAESPVDVLTDLLQRFGQPPADSATNHLSTTLGARRLRFERHTEYSRFTFITPGDAPDPVEVSAGDGILGEWLHKMEGDLLVGLHAHVVGPAERDQAIEQLSSKYFDGNTLVGSRVADGNALALTDLRIHSDGFGRILLINDGMSVSQTGRVMQRLLEIETYRMMALLALPVARQLTPLLDEDERELSSIGEGLIDAESHVEQELLDRLSRMSANSQNRHLRSNYRFAAADAYYEIVLQRIHELRESRLVGLQTFDEFTNRRLAPAVKTYRAVSQRQRSILEQIARATKLLSTRIDIARQQQNQSLLASMNRRAKAQLRLQATVEGLSVAAVTYYVVGLVGTLAESAGSMGLALNKGLVMGASVPLVAAAVFLTVRRLRRKISREEAD